MPEKWAVCPSIWRWLSVRVSESLETLLEDMCPGPSMSHRIKGWGAGPWHASARLDPGKRSRRGKRTIPQSPTGRGPRASPGVFTSAPAGRIKERTSIFLAPFPRSWTALPGPQCGGDEPCVWAGATSYKEPALLCPLLGVTGVRGRRAEKDVIVLESSRTWAPGGPQRQGGIGWHGA